MTIPNNITKGITIKWDVKLDDFLSSDWSLVYTFVSPSDKQTITAVPNGEGFSITISMNESSQFNAGRYDYQATVTDNVERFVVDTGEICVIEDFASVGSFDARSQLEQTVDAIDQYLLGQATNEQQTRKFNGREIQNHSRTELMQVRSQLKRELNIEKRQKLKSMGKSPQTKIRVIF